MLYLCYSHHVPMLRPYGSRNAHLGDSTAPSSKIPLDFHFLNCDVAKYIISKNGENLKYKNGQPTDLFIHAKDCEKCNGARIPVIEKIESLHTIEFQNKELLRQFRQWKKNNHPSESDESAIKILCDYYKYAYYTMRPEWIAYKNKYGELKK